MRIEIPDAEEAGARGAALASGVGAGVYRDIDEAMGRATGVARSHQPDPRYADLYTQRYEEYGRLIDAMSPIWETLASGPDGGAP